MNDALNLLAEPRRREILRRTWDGEVTAGEIAAGLPVSFSAVSQHLAKLREAGLVSVRRDGRKRWYRARREALGPLAEWLEAEWRGALVRLKSLAEEAEREGDDS